MSQLAERPAAIDLTMGKKSQLPLKLVHRPHNVTSLKQGLLDNLWWPTGMPDPVRNNFAHILAQILDPIRQQLLRAPSVDKGGSEGEAEDSDQSAAQSKQSKPGPSDSKGSAGTADDGVCEWSATDFQFEIGEADILQGQAFVQNAVKRVEDCAVGMLTKMSEALEAYRHKVEALPAVTAGRAAPADISLPWLSEGRGAPGGSQQAAFPCITPRNAEDETRARLRAAQEVAKRTRSPSPCCNTEVHLPHGEPAMKLPWETVQRKLGTGEIQRIDGKWVLVGPSS